MPPLNSRATRQLVKERNKVEGPKSLHRGLHLDLYADTTRSFKARQRRDGAAGRGSDAGAGAGRGDQSHRDLLVHHQKIKADLEDLYQRTSSLHKENLTMEERIEEGWLAFERIGGKLPAKVSTAIANARTQKDTRTLMTAAQATNRGSTSAALCVAPGAVPYAERLRQISADKKALQDKARWERETRGDAVDYSDGSALHALKDRRIRNFQRRQLDRAHKLRHYGDPTPLKQSGKFDDRAGTLRVFNKTIRSVRREVEHDARVSSVKAPPRRRARTESGDGDGGGRRTMWDVQAAGNINRPGSNVLRYSREWELGPLAAPGGKKGRKRGRS